MTFNDKKIWQSLIDQRQKQVLRDGVMVKFFSGDNDQPSYLEYQNIDNASLRKFENLFYPIKYPLELFDEQLNQIITFQREDYLIKTTSQYDWNRIYLKETFLCLETGCRYILAKNNATLGVHSMLLLSRLNGETYFRKLQDFMTDQNCSSIDMDEELKIPFEYQDDLNPQQNLAIKKAFNNHITFVKGPPGCGKTVTISRMVTMMAGQGRKVLIGSTSNVANYTLVNQIIKELDRWNEQAKSDSTKKKIRMIIHLSQQGLDRFDQNIERFLINEQLCELIMENEFYSNYEVKKIMQMISKVQRMQVPTYQFLEVYHKCYKRLIDETTIALTTTTNSLKLRGYTHYEPQIGILDQAAQASVSDCYGFLSFGINRMVCVGDEKQLAPTVVGNVIKNSILKKTMFELAQKNLDYVVQLLQQYRMHPKIAQFANTHVYDGILMNAQITHTQRESDLKYFRKYPISFIEHDFEEQVETVNLTALKKDERTGSMQSFEVEKGRPEYYNQLEGSLIMDFLIHVIPHDQWKNVTILTFYKRQMVEIEKGLRFFVESFGLRYEDYGLTVKTVDGYQGGQKDYIIVSTVRSNPFIRNGEFFANTNRVNVALTRAKKGLIVFGNSQTLKLENSLYSEINIWGKFYKFNAQRKSIVNFWQLESIIKNEIHSHGVIHAAYPFNIELLWTSHNLSNLLTSNKTKQKLTWQLGEKNQQIERQAKKLIKLYRKLPINDISRQQQQVIVSDFLNKEGNKQKIQYYVNQIKKQKLVRNIIEEYVLDHFTHQETTQTIMFIDLISEKITRVLFLNTQQTVDQQKLGNEIVKDIQNMVHQEKEKIKEECHGLLSELRQLSDERYVKQNTVQKIETKDSLIGLKVKFKFVKMFEQLIQPYCEDIKGQL